MEGRGLNPKIIKDKYADYWQLTTNHAKIHYQYAVKNPNKYKPIRVIPCMFIPIHL